MIFLSHVDENILCFDELNYYAFGNDVRKFWRQKYEMTESTTALDY
jgi:hypothetical protein